MKQYHVPDHGLPQHETDRPGVAVPWPAASLGLRPWPAGAFPISPSFGPAKIKTIRVFNTEQHPQFCCGKFLTTVERLVVLGMCIRLTRERDMPELQPPALSALLIGMYSV